MTESRWRQRIEEADLPPLTLLDRGGMPCEQLLVVVAHPDDETLAAGGLVHHAWSHSIPVTVLVATAGEHSHPGSPTHSPERLAAVRAHELARALGRLHPEAKWRVLGLPDGGVTAHEETLADRVGACAKPTTVIVSTWRHDGHPDHDAVGRACARAAVASGARHLEAPVWAWAWTEPDVFPWEDATSLPLCPEGRWAKRSALTAYASQLAPLSDDPADAAVVAPEVLEHFDRDVEVFLEPLTPVRSVDGFDAMYDAGPDPWRFEGSWYEERKRAVVLASLPSAGLGRVLELGPADGRLTVELAGRADSVLAVDASPRAVAAAAARVEEAGVASLVQVRQGRLPEDFPEGAFDTVVASEVAYFLTAQEWASVLRRATAALAPGGALVLVHWMHPIEGWPMDGGEAHGLAASVTGMVTTVHHVEPDFELRVLQVGGSPSLAQREGRA